MAKLDETIKESVTEALKYLGVKQKDQLYGLFIELSIYANDSAINIHDVQEQISLIIEEIRD